MPRRAFRMRLGPQKNAKSTRESHSGPRAGCVITAEAATHLFYPSSLQARPEVASHLMALSLLLAPRDEARHACAGTSAPGERITEVCAARFGKGQQPHHYISMG